MPDPKRALEHWKQQFVAELFHKLAQPLTALHCSLELALRKELTADEYRDTLGQALELSTRLIEMTKWERELAESSDPGTPARIDLAKLTREVAAEFSQLFEDCGRQFFVITDSLAPVLADPLRMRKALITLIDASLKDCGHHQALLLYVTTTANEVALYFGPNSSYLSGTVTGIARGPSVHSRKLVGNIVRAARGKLAMLALAEGSKFLVTFPSHT